MGTVESTLHHEPNNPTNAPSKAVSPIPEEKIPKSKSLPSSSPCSFDHIKTLKGVVYGPSNVGKSSLLRLLRGDGPTRQTKKRNLMALIPWKIRNQNNPVQLHIVEKHIEDEIIRPLDFMIVIVDRTKPDSMEDILEQLIHYLDKDKNIKNICFLLNYYDAFVIPSDQNKEMMTLQDAEQMTIEKISFCQDDKINLKFAHTCLKNGYGLKALHSFFDIVYLNWRERILKSELEMVEMSLCKCNDEFNDGTGESFDELEAKYRQSEEKETQMERVTTLNTTLDTDVNHANLKAVEQSKDGQSLIEGASLTLRHEKTKVHGNETQSIPSRRSILPETKTLVEIEHRHHINSRKKSKQNKEKSKSYKKNENRSISKNKRPKEIQPYIDPKQALEAFLASDDDIDDDQTLKTSNSHARVNGNNVKNVEVLDSDSDYSSVDEQPLHQSSQKEDNVRNDEETHVLPRSDLPSESKPDLQDDESTESTISNSPENDVDPQVNINMEKSPSVDANQEEEKSKDFSDPIKNDDSYIDLNDESPITSEDNISERKKDETETSRVEKPHMGVADSDSDDDGYTLKDETISIPSRRTKTNPTAQSESTKVDNDRYTSISSEALAAIAAAQKEAEQNQIHKKKKEKSEKKSKEKKSKKEKKHYTFKKKC
jgi:GTP-binding protein EngB required for normal cell division